MNEDLIILKGFGAFPSELVYDETELTIQRHLYSLKTNIVFSVLLSASIGLNIISSLTKESFGWPFYVQLVVMFLIIVLLIVSVYLLFNYRKKNKKFYRYEEIKRIDTIEINTYINLKFEFIDNSKDIIKLYRNKKSIGFIEFLKTKTEL